MFLAASSFIQLDSQNLVMSPLLMHGLGLCQFYQLCWAVFGWSQAWGWRDKVGWDGKNPVLVVFGSKSS